MTKRTVHLLFLVLTSQSTCSAFMGTYPGHTRRVLVPLYGTKSDGGKEKTDPISRILYSVESFLEGLYPGSATTKSDVVNPVDDARTLSRLEDAQREWKEEAARLARMENSVLNDPDLTSIVEQKKKKRDPTFINKESHRHDSFLAEVEHAVITDPDLTAFVESKKKDKDPTFMYKESHRHDSFLDEVEHAIDTDPDLSNIVRDDKMMHDSEIEHSGDSEPNLDFMIESSNPKQPPITY